MKWSAHPNLRFRPHAPNKGRGRLKIQVRRCFLGYRFRTTSQVFDYALARVRGDAWRQRHRWSVIRVLDQVAERVGERRSETGSQTWSTPESHQWPSAESRRVLPECRPERVVFDIRDGVVPQLLHIEARTMGHFDDPFGERGSN